MSESENDTKGFKVTDRRKFTADGEPRPESEAETAERPSPGKEPEQEPPDVRTSSAERREPAAQAGAAPDVQFLDLVNMLVTNALVQLGDVPDPVSGEAMDNLQGAQVMIEFLSLLEEKTKGNLEKEEEKILEEMLYNLRMRYLTKANLIKR